MLSMSPPIPEILPVYPLREQVVFPHMVLPLFIAPAGMATVDTALRSDSHLFVVAWCSAPSEPIFFEDLSRIGTLCRINQTVRFPDGGCKVVIEGVERIRLLNPIQMTPAVSPIWWRSISTSRSRRSSAFSNSSIRWSASRRFISF